MASGTTGEVNLTSSIDLPKLISSIFRGKLTQVICCSKCHNRSARDYHDDLRLPITSNTDVQSCVNNYFEAEILEGDNMYFCSKCNTKTNAEKFIEINKPPPVLNFQLLRYVYDMTTLTKKKLKTKIKLSSHITLPVTNEGEKSGEEYLLVSVLNHIGSSAYSGHYVCEAMDWGSGIWWKFNDEDVSLLGDGPKHFVNIKENLEVVDIDGEDEMEQNENVKFSKNVQEEEEDEDFEPKKGAAKSKRGRAIAKGKKAPAAKKQKANEGKGNATGNAKGKGKEKVRMDEELTDAVLYNTLIPPTRRFAPCPALRFAYRRRR